MSKILTLIVLTIICAIGLVHATETTTLNFEVQSTNIQTSEVTILSSSTQLSYPYNITLLDHNTGEPIESFVLSTASQSEEVPLGRYDVFVVQGTEEIVLDNNGTGYIAGDTIIVPLYCDPSAITCQLEDKYYLDLPWRVESQYSGSIPIFAIVNTNSDAIECINVYDHNNGDAYVTGKSYTPFYPTNLPFSETFYVDKSKLTVVDGKISVKIKFCLDWDLDNWEGPAEALVDTNDLPQLNNWYSGDTHFHSEYTYNAVEFGSPVENTVDAGKAIGLNWVTITDHSFDLDSTKFSNLETECNSYSDSSFKCIRGEKIFAYLISMEV